MDCKRDHKFHTCAQCIDTLWSARGGRVFPWCSSSSTYHCLASTSTRWLDSPRSSASLGAHTWIFTGISPSHTWLWCCPVSSLNLDPVSLIPWRALCTGDRKNFWPATSLYILCRRTCCSVHLTPVWLGFLHRWRRRRFEPILGCLSWRPQTVCCQESYSRAWLSCGNLWFSSRRRGLLEPSVIFK